MTARGALIAGLIVAVLSALPSAEAREQPARRASVDARIVGTFGMLAHVTTAVGVNGEHRGQTLHRSWSIVPQRCPVVGDVCRRLILERQRSDHIEERVVLHRVGRGQYTGTGTFYVALRCNGTVYRHGSRARFRITLRVTRTARVQGELFARRIRATYDNPSRTDATPCPLGPSHDAATYLGQATSALPQPPVASFVATTAAEGDRVRFTNESAGRSGAAVVKQKWFFDDPASGSANSSLAVDPTHTFSAPGTYEVTLVVLDGHGLYDVVSQAVTVPSPPAT